MVIIIRGSPIIYDATQKAKSKLITNQLFGGKDWTQQSGQIQVQCSCNGGAGMSIGSTVPIYKVNSKVTSKSLRIRTRHGNCLWAVGAAKGGVWYYFVAANPSLKQQIRAMISFCILSAPIFEQGSHSRFVVAAIDIIMKRELGSKPAAELSEKFKPPYWFSAHLHCKFYDLVQHGDGGQVTKFLALDKCVPEKKFCGYNSVYPLAKHLDFRTLNLDMKECCDWERSKLQLRGTKLFEFVRTVPCHNSTQTVANGSFSGHNRNPQTEALLQFLELPYVLDQSEPAQCLASSMSRGMNVVYMGSTYSFVTLLYNVWTKNGEKDKESADTSKQI
nr:lariat debranching enzyme, C-terminal [Tanacetum cinerariifolium]